MIATALRPEVGAVPAVTSPAVGSLAMAEVLSAPLRPWRVLGTTTHARWCTTGDDVLVLADDMTARLPNALIVPTGFGTGFQGTTPGEGLLIGDRRVISSAGEWHIVRWWDPHVHPVPGDRANIRRCVVRAARMVPARRGVPIVEALRTNDADGAIISAAAVLGRGPGLTPEEDDVVVGVIAGFRHVAASTRDAAAMSTIAAVREPLLLAARSSTTLLSRSLLRHAFSGAVAAPLGSLLRALSGRGGIETAAAATSAIGHSSGPALAGGAVAGAAAACDLKL